MAPTEVSSGLNLPSCLYSLYKYSVKNEIEQIPCYPYFIKDHRSSTFLLPSLRPPSHGEKVCMMPSCMNKKDLIQRQKCTSL